MFKQIIKRDGRRVEYNRDKITQAILKSMAASNYLNQSESEKLAEIVEQRLEEKYQDKSPSVEDIQDMVENILIEKHNQII